MLLVRKCFNTSVGMNGSVHFSAVGGTSVFVDRVHYCMFLSSRQENLSPPATTETCHSTHYYIQEIRCVLCSVFWFILSTFKFFTLILFCLAKV